MLKTVSDWCSNCLQNKMPEKHMVSYCTFSYGGSILQVGFYRFSCILRSPLTDNFSKESILKVFDNNLSVGCRTNSNVSI